MISGFYKQINNTYIYRRFYLIGKYNWLIQCFYGQKLKHPQKAMTSCFSDEKQKPILIKGST